MSRSPKAEFWQMLSNTGKSIEAISSSVSSQNSRLSLMVCVCVVYVCPVTTASYDVTQLTMTSVMSHT